MINKEHGKEILESGQAIVGIELGSTRIKAVLIAPDHTPLAAGGFSWENRLEDGVWTYHLDDVWTGLQSCWKALCADVSKTYGVTLRRIAGLGISAMMHGYLVFDQNGIQLTPFRTWRNTMTEEAAAKLTELFGFNIPQRWSIAHLYQAMLRQESHLPAIACMTTLAGYVHHKLTGEMVLGVGEASGMFPIDSAACDYDEDMVQKFNALLDQHGLPYHLRDIMPRVLTAGCAAGCLTAEGAALLDPTGVLQPGVPLCPPEGDVGTGMAATNSVSPRTGNVSAGTSIFSMLVLEKPLTGVYPEIDLVTTPDGAPTAMVHCNNCTSDLNAWISLFRQTLQLFGCTADDDTLYGELYRQALQGDPDCGGLMAYNYFSGEPVTQLDAGRPLFVRQPDAAFTLPNFMRTLLLSSLAALKIGMNLLQEQEKVEIDCLAGHGGFFKTPGVGQRLLAAAMNTPVSVTATAGEGGAWGIALLAAYLLQKQAGETLADYLAHRVFAASETVTLSPDPADVQGCSQFLRQYAAGLACERLATEVFPGANA